MITLSERRLRAIVREEIRYKNSQLLLSEGVMDIVSQLAQAIPDLVNVISSMPSKEEAAAKLANPDQNVQPAVVLEMILIIKGRAILAAAVRVISWIIEFALSDTGIEILSILFTNREKIREFLGNVKNSLQKSDKELKKGDISQLQLPPAQQQQYYEYYQQGLQQQQQAINQIEDKLTMSNEESLQYIQSQVGAPEPPKNFKADVLEEPKPGTGPLAKPGSWLSPGKYVCVYHTLYRQTYVGQIVRLADNDHAEVLFSYGRVEYVHKYFMKPFTPNCW